MTKSKYKPEKPAPRTLGFCDDVYHEKLRREAVRSHEWDCATDVLFNCLQCKSTLLVPGNDWEEDTVVEPYSTIQELVEQGRNKPTLSMKKRSNPV